ncbi:MAG TPA: carboxypeptidase-like regulatory domain-containing protein [Dongiaceae bacterium]|nr:carboxypeptidase-like regulatory domain-containing protein [Dongiaceae bacterium]
MRPKLLAALAAGALFLAGIAVCGQDPPQPQAPAPPPQTSAAPAAQESTSKQKSNGHANDFLVRGTVFTQEGLALPGAELRIRRSTEKKFRWTDYSNSRGDFAIRVKMGDDYEVVVRAKGFADQTQAVNAHTGERVKDLVFRMPHKGGQS